MNMTIGFLAGTGLAALSFFETALTALKTFFAFVTAAPVFRDWVLYEGMICFL